MLHLWAGQEIKAYSFVVWVPLVCKAAKIGVAILKKRLVGGVSDGLDQDVTLD